MITTANLGFPRMGADRELKWALEKYWRGELDAAGLAAVGRELRVRHWRLQADRGIDRIPSGDFSLYDHVLDTAVTVGAVPGRFGGPFAMEETDAGALDRYFLMARGGPGVAALELTKWFDTNYHYLVPELDPDQEFAFRSSTAVAHFAEAKEAGITTRPTILGPVTFLRLAKRTDGGRPIELLDALLPAYEAWVGSLVAAGATALQIDEPALASDLDPAEVEAYRAAFPRLRRAAGDVEIMLATYFGPLGDNLALAGSLPVDLVHLDLVRSPHQLEDAIDAVPPATGLSLGVVDGRNVWRADLEDVLDRVRPALARRGAAGIHLAPSCSLLHLPVDATREAATDPELAGWLAFATERLDEIATLAAALEHDPEAEDAVSAGAVARAARLASPRVRRPAVRTRLAGVTDDDLHRASPYAARAEHQRRRLALPALPTTTIGSFPQTPEVRRLRAAFRSGEVDVAAYEAGLEEATEACVRRQEQLGLDVLVHGEFERTDMVEYFGQQLDGFATTLHGWVQSYGSRCVKPPVLYGDVDRPEPMTVRWASFAAGLTDRPMKGMLTGPVTILQWSFVRDDQPEADTARQVALALRDEVGDLEAAGIGVIQIDEPALREGLPLRVADREEYLAWAVDAFRLASSGVADETQIHTHMCYAEFGPVLDAIVALDADVISMEASRSGMELLAELRDAAYPNEVGPGVWDIHSPRVPAGAELDGLLAASLAALGPDRLWVNPDCGLKTRGWSEVDAALQAMVDAAARARSVLAQP